MTNVYPMQIERAVVRLSCSGCGADAVASCNCHKPYIPNTEQKRAFIAEALKANPEKSDRQVGKEIGADNKTVGVVRAALEENEEIPHSEAKTGPKRGKKPESNNDLPSEEEAEASYQETLYDQACLFLERMTGETRQRLFAHIRKTYHGYT